MDYKIPDDIKSLCDKDSLKDRKEQEIVKKEIVKFLTYYLDFKKGKNSLANVTDIVSKDGEFRVKATVYPFERDVAGRMMRTRNYTMQEGVNEAGKKEVYVIAADRDWWDRNKFWFSILMIFAGTVIGSLSNPLSNLIDRLINKAPAKTEVFRVKVQTQSAPILRQTDSIYNLEIEKMESAKTLTTKMVLFFL